MKCCRSVVMLAHLLDLTRLVGMMGMNKWRGDTGNDKSRPIMAAPVFIYDYAIRSFAKSSWCLWAIEIQNTLHFFNDYWCMFFPGDFTFPDQIDLIAEDIVCFGEACILGHGEGLNASR